MEPASAPAERQRTSATGRSAHIVAPGDARVVETARAEPGPGQVEVRLEGCGVCGSNLPVWEGRPWFDYPVPPGRPGHEGWGRVSRLGEGVESLREGQRVAFLSDSAFAEYDVAEADQCVALPAALDGDPFPGEPLACAMNVFRRSGIERGDRVAVVGVGFLGAVVTQLAVRAGATVLALSRRPFALEVGWGMGAHETLRLGDDAEVVGRVRELTDGDLCDVVVEAAGVQATLDVASELVRERGRLVVAGYHQDGLRQVNMQLWNWRGIDVINAHERDSAVYVDGMRRAVAAVTEGSLVLDPLVTHTLPLDRLADALDLLSERPDGFLKAVVVP